MSRETISGVRGGLVWLLLTAGTVGLVHVARQGVPPPSDLPDRAFTDLLAALAAVSTCLAATGLWASSSIFLARAARGARTSSRVCPRPLQRLLLLGCGAALAGTFAAPAQAVPVQGAPDRAVPVRTLPEQSAPAVLDVHTLAALPMPDRPTGAPRRAQAPREQTVVVAPGDTLWALAAEQLGREASVPEISAAVRLLHTTNRDVLGDDPDLIRPGTRLRLPDLRGLR